MKKHSWDSIVNTHFLYPHTTFSRLCERENTNGMLVFISFLWTKMLVDTYVRIYACTCTYTKCSSILKWIVQYKMESFDRKYRKIRFLLIMSWYLNYYQFNLQLRGVISNIPQNKIFCNREGFCKTSFWIQFSDLSIQKNKIINKAFPVKRTMPSY